MSDFAVTSPELPVRDKGIVTTRKEFSDALTLDLTDEEIQRCMEILLPIRDKHQRRFISKFSGDPSFNVEQAMKMVDEFEDEIKYEAATKLNILVGVDVSPLFEGKAMIVDFIGTLPGHTASRYGLDHEKKQAEVRTATERGEDYLGQKGN